MKQHIRIIYKLLIKYWSQQVFKNLELDDWQKRDPDDDDRMKGYANLCTNSKMMKNLERMMIEDTKEMMKQDWADETTRSLRVGAFVRTKAIIDKANELFKKYNEIVKSKK